MMQKPIILGLKGKGYETLYVNVLNISHFFEAKMDNGEKREAGFAVGLNRQKVVLYFNGGTNKVHLMNMTASTVAARIRRAIRENKT